MSIWERRWNVFKSFRRSVYSFWLLVFFLFFSLTAEIWSNDKPLVLFYNNQIYFPVIKNYHPVELGLPEGRVTVDYKNLNSQKKVRALWPLVPWGPYESNTQVNDYPSAPSLTNLMGTDNRGRDVLSRLLYGFRYSFGYALLVWIGAFLLGKILGMVMGFKAGWVDLFLQRCVEIFQSMPSLLTLITLIAVLGSHFSILVIYGILFGWMNISLYVRSEYLKVRNLEFVHSAKAYGASSSRIMWRHILPNALTPLLTFSPFKIAQGIYSLAILDYLGFGLAPPTPSWGELLLQAEQYFSIAWWLAFFPSLFLFLTLMSLNFIGEGIRAAFDPQN